MYVRKTTGGGALRAISRLAAPLLQSRTEVRSLAYSPQNATLPRTASADGNIRYRIAVWWYCIRPGSSLPAVSAHIRQATLVRREKTAGSRTERNGVNGGNGDYVCGEVFRTQRVCRASLPCITPRTNAVCILLHPGYPFTPFNSVQLRSKGGRFFSRGHRTCLAGSELVTKRQLARVSAKPRWFGARRRQAPERRGTE